MNDHQFKRSAGNRGFSLVEAIVVMAVLSIVTLAIMSFIIPTQQSMRMQSNVTDVQTNLNLAMNVMTRDLLMAGFLVDPAFDPPTSDAACPGHWKGDTTSDNMAAGSIFWQRHNASTGNAFTDDPTDLTIRTRAFGNAFAVISAVDADSDITPTSPDMFDGFCNGNTVKVGKARVFNAVSMKELNCVDYVCEMTPTAATTVSTCANTATPKTFRVGLAATSLSNAMVVVGTNSDATRSLHTIRYRVNSGALERIVDGVTQNLARGVTSVNFAYVRSSSGQIKRVDVALTGVIAAMKGGDAQLGEKTRTLTTSVNLRNSF